MSEIKINDESYSELGTEQKNQDNWAALYFEKLLSEHKSQTSEQCSKAIADSESAVTTAEAAQAAAQTASEAAQMAVATTAEAKAIAAEASADVVVVDAKVGDLSKANYGYFPSNVVEYVNQVEKNLLLVAEHCQQTTADVAAAKADKTSLSETDAELARVRDEVIPTKADKTYVDAELLKKQDKELEWTLLDNITLTEDIQKYAINFLAKGNVYGAKMIIEVPTDVAIGSGNIMAINENNAWIQDFTTTAYNAGTYRSKIIVTTWIPQHGYYEATCTERTGVNLTAGKLLYNFKTSLFKAIRLSGVQFRGNLYTGTIIKVWGLVK